MGLFEAPQPTGNVTTRRRYNKARCQAVICRRLAESDKSLQELCRAKRYLPSAATFCDWLAADPQLAERYTQSLRSHVDFLARQIISIADNRVDNPIAVRNSVDARKWIASKLMPQKYGDKLDISGTVTVQNDVTSLQTALALHHILQRLEERRAAAGGELIELAPTQGRLG